MKVFPNWLYLFCQWVEDFGLLCLWLSLWAVSILLLAFINRQEHYLQVKTCCFFCLLAQFLVYFIYFILLTVIYIVGAAVVLIRHYRNQPRGGGGTNEQAAPVELHPVAAGSEAETLSNGRSAEV